MRVASGTPMKNSPAKIATPVKQPAVDKVATPNKINLSENKVSTPNKQASDKVKSSTPSKEASPMKVATPNKVNDVKIMSPLKYHSPVKVSSPLKASIAASSQQRLETPKKTLHNELLKNVVYKQSISSPAKEAFSSKKDIQMEASKGVVGSSSTPTKIANSPLKAAQSPSVHDSAKKVQNCSLKPAIVSVKLEDIISSPMKKVETPKKTLSEALLDFLPGSAKKGTPISAKSTTKTLDSLLDLDNSPVKVKSPTKESWNEAAKRLSNSNSLPISASEDKVNVNVVMQIEEIIEPEKIAPEASVNVSEPIVAEPIESSVSESIVAEPIESSVPEAEHNQISEKQAAVVVQEVVENVVNEKMDDSVAPAVADSVVTPVLSPKKQTPQTEVKAAKKAVKQTAVEAIATPNARGTRRRKADDKIEQQKETVATPSKRTRKSAKVSPAKHNEQSEEPLPVAEAIKEVVEEVIESVTSEAAAVVETVRDVVNSAVEAVKEAVGLADEEKEEEGPEKKGKRTAKKSSPVAKKAKATESASSEIESSSSTAEVEAPKRSTRAKKAVEVLTIEPKATRSRASKKVEAEIVETPTTGTRTRKVSAEKKEEKPAVSKRGKKANEKIEEAAATPKRTRKTAEKPAPKETREEKKETEAPRRSKLTANKAIPAPKKSLAVSRSSISDVEIDVKNKKTAPKKVVEKPAKSRSKSADKEQSTDSSDKEVLKPTRGTSKSSNVVETKSNGKAGAKKKGTEAAKEDLHEDKENISKKGGKVAELKKAAAVQEVQSSPIRRSSRSAAKTVLTVSDSEVKPAKRLRSK